MVTFFRRRFLSCQGLYPRIKWFSRYLIQFVNSNHFEGFPGLSDLFEPRISFGFLDPHHRKYLIGTIKQTVDLFLGHAFFSFPTDSIKELLLKIKVWWIEPDTKSGFWKWCREPTSFQKLLNASIPFSMKYYPFFFKKSTVCSKFHSLFTIIPFEKSICDN